MVNGVLAGRVVTGAPRGGNPTPRPPPRPAAAAATTLKPRPRVWLGILAVAPKAEVVNPLFLRAKPAVDITPHPTPARITRRHGERGGGEAKQMRRRSGQSRCELLWHPWRGKEEPHGKYLAGKEEARGIRRAWRCETTPPTVRR
jgi:hypothetical protein